MAIQRINGPLYNAVVPVTTANSGGQILNPGGIIVGSAGASKVLAKTSEIGLDIPATQPVTLCVRRVSGTNATLSALVLAWKEEW